MTPEQGLRLAWRATQCAQGWCAPNPAVGAVFIHGGSVQGVGCHQGPGTAHAEVMATRHLPEEMLRQGVLYVTLEPCCHHGRTPPCTQWILDHGIRRVYYAHGDPNPLVSGRGNTVLRSHGVHCEQVMVPAITDFYRAYDHWWQAQRPWVTLKAALNRHGVMAHPPGQERLMITHGRMTQRHTHAHRLVADALVTTATTLLADQPQLNVRWEGQVLPKPVVVLGGAWCPDVLATQQARSVHWCYEAQRVSQLALDDASALGVQLHPCASQPGGLDLVEVLDVLGEQGFHRLWVEVGPRCAEALLSQGLVNELHLLLGMHDTSPGLSFPAMEAVWPGHWQGQWAYLGHAQWLWQGCRA